MDLFWLDYIFKVQPNNIVTSETVVINYKLECVTIDKGVHCSLYSLYKMVWWNRVVQPNGKNGICHLLILVIRTLVLTVKYIFNDMIIMIVITHEDGICVFNPSK